MAMQELRQKEERILFLDFLRIFAFLSVLVGHLFYIELTSQSNNPQQHDTIRSLLKFALPFFHAGAGVIVFFLVSGYIITHILQTESPIEFAIKRVFRIYPLYIFTVLSTYLIAWEPIDFSILIPQLLLMGDLFETPYALAGIEWTLRVEIMFYVIMALLKTVGLMDAYKKFLPWAFLTIIVAVHHFGPFPNWNDATRASYSIGFQFLFLGAVFYLREKNQIKTWFLLLFGTVAMYQYFHLTRLYIPYLLNDNYASLALMLFVLFWLLRKQLKPHKHVLLLSNLTYAVYLTHITIDGVWDILVAKYVPKMTHSAFDLILMCVILLISFVISKFIEKPSNKLGHRLASRYSLAFGKK